MLVYWIYVIILVVLVVYCGFYLSKFNMNEVLQGAIANEEEILADDGVPSDLNVPDNIFGGVDYADYDNDSARPSTGAGGANAILGGREYGQYDNDEYDNVKLLLMRVPNYFDDIQNVVVDGNNLIYTLMGEDMRHINNKRYAEYLRKSLDLCVREFANKTIYFILKVDNKINVQDFVTHPNLFIVVTEGKLKARDDFGVVFFSDRIAEPTAVVTRDRYRDIINIATSNATKFVIYGQDKARAKELEKRFNKKETDKFLNIGNWSFKSRLLGYTFTKSAAPGVWQRKTRAMNVPVSEFVLVIKL